MTVQSESILSEESRIDQIGTSVPRIDSLPKVTGKVLYTRDMKLPRMLFAKIKRSPFPHARILKIDFSKVRNMPGVRAAISGSDFPPATSEDTPPLAQGEVLYANQSVVAVAAETERIAEQALGDIEIEYEELSAVFDPELAMNEKQTPTIIRHYPGEATESPNIAVHLKVRKGEFDRFIAKADHIIENRFTTAMESHFQLEPLTFLAQPDEDGGVTLWATSMGAHVTEFRVSRYLGMDPYLVRAKIPLLGGWFGGKQEAHLGAVCALLALKSKRPVKLELSREETMTASGVRHPTIIHIKDGVSSSGRILAREIRAIYNGGAYASESNFLLRNSITSASAVYDIPNVKVDSYRIYTNLVPGTPKRDPVGMQMVYSIESQMDCVAAKLGLDPVEVRLKNILVEGRENAIGETMESISHDKCLNAVARAIQWNNRSKDDGDGPWKIGKGIAVGAKWAVGGIYQSMVRVRETGKVELWSDVIENGDGVYTGIAQIVASEFGIPVSDVIFMPMIAGGAESTSTGLTQGASGARQLVNAGMAALLACRDAKRRIAERASKLFGWDPAIIDVKFGNVFISAESGRESKSGNKNERTSVKLTELFTKATILYNVSAGYSLDEGFVGFGTSNKAMGDLDPETGRCVGGRVSPYYVSAAQGAEVQVNVETGQVKVLMVAAAMDVGKAINPELIRGQIRGAVMMGLSAALSEELVVSPVDGRIANPNLADYKILTAVDAPTIEPIIIETPYKDGPYGAKGAGEASSLATAAAVRNAIHDAVGIWINDLPITPERVLERLFEERRE